MRISLLFFSLIFSLFTLNTTFATTTLPNPDGEKQSVLPSPHNVTQNLDRVVAVVNDDVITESDLETAFNRAKEQMIAAHAQHMDDTQLKNALLQQLINEKLQLQLAKQAGISVPNAEVTKTIADIAKANHLTLEQLAAKLQAEGLSMAAYKDMLHKQLLIHQVQMSAIGQKVQVTDQEAQEFLDKYREKLAQDKRYHVLDIHIPVASDSKAAMDDAQKKALQLMAAWKQGKQVTPQPVDLGWQSSDTLPALFLNQLNHMKPGNIAGPIVAPNGLHLIKLVAVKNNASGKMPSIAEAKNRVFQTKAQKEVQDWLKKMRESAYIQISPDL